MLKHVLDMHKEDNEKIEFGTRVIKFTRSSFDNRWQKNLLKKKKSFHQDPSHQKTINCRRTVFLLDELHIGDLGVSERHIKARNIFHFLGLRILQRWHRNLLEKKKTFHQDPSHQKTINCRRNVFSKRVKSH